MYGPTDHLILITLKKVCFKLTHGGFHLDR